MKKTLVVILMATIQISISTSACAALSALWIFEGESGLFVDSSTNNNDAAPGNDPQTPFRVPGEALFGNALELDGNDYAVVADSPEISLTGDFTIAARVYVPAYGSNKLTIMHKLGDAISGYYSKYSWSIKTDGFQNLTISDQSQIINYGGPNIAPGQWIHIGIVRDLAAGTLTWFGNGIGGKVTKNVVVGALPDSAGELYIGATGSSGGNGFEGKLDDIQIFDHALSDAEMADIAQPRTQVLNATMETGAGTTVFDQTVFHNDGEFGLSTNSPVWGMGDINQGNALVFDGDDYVEVAQDVSLSVMPQGLTINVDIYRTTDDINSIVYKLDNGSSFAFKLNVKTDGFLNISVGDGTSIKNFSGFYVGLNEWTKCTISIDMVTHKIVWYKNDQLSKAGFFTGISSVKNSTGPFVIGASNTSGVNGFHGTIDNVELYNVPTLDSATAPVGEFELSIAGTGYFSPVIAGSINNVSYTIKNLTGFSKSYSILVTDDHVLVDENLTLTTETLAAGEEKTIIAAIDASQPGVHKVTVEVMNSSSPFNNVAIATSNVNVWNPAGNTYVDNVPNFFGMMTVFDRHVDKLGIDVPLFANMGVKVSRFLVRWNELEASKGVYDWTKWDTIINALNSSGVKPVPFLWTTPPWAYDAAAREEAKAIYGATSVTNSPPINYQDYYDTMAALVARYDHTSVPFWEIWNEPYLGIFWYYPANSVPSSEENFVTLLQGTYSAIKNVDAQTQIIVGGQAAGSNPYSDYVVTNGKDYYDIYSSHSHGHVDQHISAHEVSDQRLNTFDPNKRDKWWVNETGFAYNVKNDVSQAVALIKKGTITRHYGAKNFMWFVFRSRRDNHAVGTTSFEAIDENFGLRPSVVSYNALVGFLQNTTPGAELYPNDPIGNYGYAFNRGIEKIFVLWNEKKLENTIQLPVVNGVSTVEQYNIFGAANTVPVVNGNVSVTLDFTPKIIVITYPDADADGLSDELENAIGTNPLLTDTDGDGITDYDEVNYGGDQNVYTLGADTNPLSQDTDGDGVLDGVDVQPLTTNIAGDVAPLGAPDGLVNAADYLIQMQFFLGLTTPTAIELQNGDLYPTGSPDGGITTSDMLLMLQLVWP
ncbi:MAG TPA: hypothetical protein EYO59_02200 [Chromatiaceae bacterium]|nr:hypothetical protein [Chromatiaceae bacterium]